MFLVHNYSIFTVLKESVPIDLEDFFFEKTLEEISIERICV